MGTPPFPDPKPPVGDEASVFQDVPRTGPIVWLLLACFLLPPAAVSILGNRLGGIPHQTLWVVLLGLPIPLILLALPRRYTLDRTHLSISGFLYRKKIPLEQIVLVEPIGAFRALLHPGSLFCSDPARALKLMRKKGRILIISPTDPAPFLALGGQTSRGVEP